MYKIALAAATAASIASSAHAITYNVNFTVGDISVDGFITTDGTLGAVDGVDEFLDFNLNVTVPGFGFTFVDPNFSFLRGGGFAVASDRGQADLRFCCECARLHWWL